ncbi:MAG: HlyD family efflux transporter periplasmic adaptor subunit [Planctomycetaceae bacterium]|nr:HlyD family efflux transporter periplasmic adaptor subunit [Planctomycetaceae bacterium]
MSQTSVKSIPKRRVTESGDAPVDVRQLGDNLQQVLATASSEAEAIESLLRVAKQLMRAEVMVYFDADSAGQVSDCPMGQVPAPITESLLHKLYSLAVLTRETAAVQIARIEQAEGVIGVAVPVFRTDQVIEVMVVVADSGEYLQRRLAELVQVVQLMAAFAGQWRGRLAASKVTHEQSQWIRFSEVIVEAGQIEPLSSAISKLADGVEEILQASFVAVGLRRSGGLVKLVAMSKQLQFDQASELTKKLEEVMAEAMISGDNRPAADETPGRKTEALVELEKMLRVGSIYRAILRNGNGEAVGAFVVARKEPIGIADQKSVDWVGRLLGHEVALRNQVRPGWLVRAKRRYENLSRPYKQVVIAVSVVATLMLFAFPVPHRIVARCEIQPVSRRFVAAPYEGRLEKAFVEPGDVVKEGQTIARMDAREIRLERASLEADLVRSIKQRDTSMASGDAVGTQMAEFESRRLRLRLQLLQDRMEHLKVKTPTDGMVISGDPRKLEGSRLRIGQTLVEVSPLGENVAEIAIPDEDIAHVEIGQQVAFRLEALPYSRFEGVIESLQPRSVQQDSANVFLAEVKIHADAELLQAGLLRPGMRGRAKVEAKSRSLAWVLFHRAWEHVLFRMGW